MEEETILKSEEKSHSVGYPNSASSNYDLANSEAKRYIESIETNGGKDETNSAQNEMGYEVSEEEIASDNCDDAKEN